MLVLALYCCLIGYKLMRLGLHGDGVEYSAVAANLADGVGTFWKPYLDDRIHPVFHEHPPLAFWIQSLFFRAFGRGAYLESFYGFFVGLVILGCTAGFWHRVRRDLQLPALGSWWPLLLLTSLPIFTYMLQTNRIVNTWTIFAIVATTIAYRSVSSEGRHLFYSLLAGGVVYLGFLTKGPVALFTLAVPVLASLTLKARFPRAVTSTLLAGAAFAVLFGGTSWLFPDSVDFWRGFWRSQVVVSLTNQRAPGDTHWYLAERWLSEMIIPLLIAGLLIPIAGISFRRIRCRREVLFFLLVALCASLPFVVSTRQHARYILHSFPFYVLSLAFATDQIAGRIESRLTDKRRLCQGLTAAAMVLFVAASAGMLYFKDRDAKRRPFYHDFYLQHIELPERITISVCPEDIIYYDWLFADMQRFYKANLTPEPGRRYLIIAKNSGCTIPENYRIVNRQPTLKYVLYRKADP